MYLYDKNQELEIIWRLLLTSVFRIAYIKILAKLELILFCRDYTNFISKTCMLKCFKILFHKSAEADDVTIYFIFSKLRKFTKNTWRTFCFNYFSKLWGSRVKSVFKTTDSFFKAISLDTARLSITFRWSHTIWVWSDGFVNFSRAACILPRRQIFIQQSWIRCKKCQKYVKANFSRPHWAVRFQVQASLRISSELF